ncbi:MAG: NUDIX domain-containing protein [Dehalococcoidia bacterium]
MHCGGRLERRVPRGDLKSRLVCTACGFVHYLNPRPVAGTVPLRRSEGRLLLVRRAIEPQSGKWVFPGGFMDVGETAEQAACRETAEEANLEVDDLRLLGVYTRPDPGIVIVVFTARALSEARAGHETSEVRWFLPEEIPWDELAFDSTSAALRDLLHRGDLETAPHPS